MSVTLPTHNWDFLITGAANSTHSDSISNSTATYGSNVTSDATNGATVDTDNITLPSIAFSSSYSFEFYIRLNSNQNYAGIFTFEQASNNLIYADMFGTNQKIRYVMKPGGSSAFASHGQGTHDGTLMTTDGTTYHHIVCTFNNSTGEANYYQDNTAVWTQTGISVDESNFPITSSNDSKLGNDGNGCNFNMKYFRIWTNYALSATEVTSLYNFRDTNYFLFANMRINYGDIYLTQTLNKTIEDYKNENIPLHDISFGAFTAINRLKETYIQGPVDISGDVIVRSDNNIFYDISAVNIGFSTDLVTPKLITNDVSLNNRFFVGGDASFNSNVTIQGDLSLGSSISYPGTLANSALNLGDSSVKTFANDISLNSNLTIHGQTTVKNDLYLNAYTDVSTNPVLSDGTYLKNMKMDKLNHQYIMDISRSSPFSTLTSKTLPSEIWDTSSNSGICISADGKYIRTVNSGDLSNNAFSYYSEDYGNSFHKDDELSRKLSLVDITSSLHYDPYNTADGYDTYHGDTIHGVTITDAPTFGNYLTSGSYSTQTFTVDGITYSCYLTDGVRDNDGAIWKAFQDGGSSSSNTCSTSRTNNYHAYNGTYTSRTLSYIDFDGNSDSVNGQSMVIDIDDGNNGYFQVTQAKANSIYPNNYMTEWQVFGRDSDGDTRQLSGAVTGGYNTLVTIPITATTMVNRIYITGTKAYTSNKFISFHNIEFSLETPDSVTPVTNFKCGSDKSFMSYNGQHQLVPRGLSNKLTLDDYLYVSNDFGKNWNLRKNTQDISGNFNSSVGSGVKSSWFWNTGAVSADGKHMYVSGSTGFWKSSDYGRVWNQTSADSSFNFMSISADGKLVYGVNERKVYGSTDYGNTFSTLYTDSYTSDSSYCGISTSGNGKYLTIADGRSSDLYLSTDYGNSFTLHTPSESGTVSLNCGISHSGKIILNSNYISFDYGNNFTYVPDLISNQLTNNDTFYSKANMEYIIDASNNALLQIPYKSAIFQDIYSVGSIKVGSTTYSSDYRLKENIQPLTDNETVNELHPVKYYNTNLKKNDYGLLAHELQEKYPFLVNGEKDGAEYQSINYNGLISLLVHEVKNLKKEYQELVEMKNNA